MVETLEGSGRGRAPLTAVLRGLSLRLVAGVARLLGARGIAAIAFSQIGEIKVAAGNYVGAAACYKLAFEHDCDPHLMTPRGLPISRGSSIILWSLTNELRSWTASNCFQ